MCPVMKRDRVEFVQGTGIQREKNNSGMSSR